ncbi:MAG: 2-oxoacid:acceptor oxidoreductase subunit alpha [Rhodospirillales bacterium]|jgi:2-oxoglutarate ferredoxin oxidoreductase subunit alpha|nr:2-oxoacid:acceptor oxidoreductase subunit alpha [Rhodospirillales bacterium]HJO97896.1 2-oxoacid:acceptor oxidoreductase subunit alpha [Rhodospirillales bacterium]
MINNGGKPDSVSVALAGSGGSGLMTAGEMLLDVARDVGWYGMMARSLSPHIRGGEAAAFIRLSPNEVGSCDDLFDIVVALDWTAIRRFAAEVPLGSGTLVIYDTAAGEPPEATTASGARLVALPLGEMAKEIPQGRPNMVALGIVTALIGIPEEVALATIKRAIADKGAEAVTASAAGIKAGTKAAADLNADYSIGEAAAPGANGRWSISGNEATGLGALSGGIRFAAAYPITPATEILEWLAPNLQEMGGALVQAEDELASINMIIGASFGGTPSMTATSGPGLSLMIEGIGLAIAAETPVVIVDVMRCGPSTGLPAKSEQADLNIALYCSHGDAPHIVTAATSAGDCIFTTQWSAHLAEKLQCPAIVLTDQWLGQSRVIIDEPAEVPFIAERDTAAAGIENYQRYMDTTSGISPMALPGTPGGEHEAMSSGHNAFGAPSGSAADHEQQLDKRQRKLEEFDFGDVWAEIEGEGEVAVVTWGSTTGAVREALTRAKENGLQARLIGFRLLQPMQVDYFAAAMKGVKKVLIVEQSHGQQFHNYLRAHFHQHLPETVKVFNRPGPLPIRPGQVLEQLSEWS